MFCTKNTLLNAYYHFVVKPEINMAALKYIFERGITINCTLKTPKVNPPVNYTWFSCDSPETCDKKSEINKTFSLQLESQSKHYMKYMCNATNAAGSDSETIEVFSKCTFLPVCYRWCYKNCNMDSNDYD